MHYVGLSRVRNLNGLLLQEFDAKKICCSQKVKVEMQRLRTTSKFTPCVPFIDSLTASIKICFHNVRSLPLHINDVRCDVNVDAADMNIFVETNLTTAHHSENLQIEHFQLFRNGNISDEGSYGTAFYVRENLQLAKEPCRVNKNHVEITFCILGGPVPNLHVFSVYRSKDLIRFDRCAKCFLRLLKLPKTERWEGVNFLGTARSCGGIYCDPGLLRRGLGSGACGKCSEGKQAWLKKSLTLESFDKD